MYIAYMGISVDLNEHWMTLLDKLYLYKPSDVIDRGPPFTSLIIEKSKHHKQTVPTVRGVIAEICARIIFV